MAHQLYIFLFVVLVNIISDVKSDRVKITVGTTSACSDTVNFINTQLVPTYREYGEFLEVEFIPWGRTVQQEDGSQACQFLANDCWANRMHRCALNLLREDQDRQVDFMACEFTVPLPGFGRGSYECAIAAGLNVVDVDYCVNNPSQDTLDQEAQTASVAPMSVINFVPFIVINDEIDVPTHNQARSRLSNIVCFLLAADETTGISGCEIE